MLPTTRIKYKPFSEIIWKDWTWNENINRVFLSKSKLYYSLWRKITIVTVRNKVSFSRPRFARIQVVPERQSIYHLLQLSLSNWYPEIANFILIERLALLTQTFAKSSSNLLFDQWWMQIIGKCGSLSRSISPNLR